jgi:beta-lactamase regulating signal transducer with metallopeptidase domain
MFHLDSGNLLAWMAQSLVIAGVGALLPLVFRLRHPPTQLLYGHLLLVVCLLLPILQKPVSPAPQPALWAALRNATLIWWIAGAGVAARLAWLLAGLWRIRQHRIAAMPLYPVPESAQAASAITHANAVLCISQEAPGPVMLGWLNPVVLLPETFSNLDDEAQCSIVCHELLHVRRHDWLVTLLEEVAGALMWFNPGTWLLLAQTRLAREQVVDRETVRLTAANDSYIHALLAIARGGSVVDLAPAPLFLRRRHLTQRMHALLEEVPMSKYRILASYCSMTTLLVLAGWLACNSFPLVAQPAPQQAQTPSTAPQPTGVMLNGPWVRVPLVPGKLASSETVPPAPGRPAADSGMPSAPIPFDPYEPVTGGIETVTAPQDRAALVALWERAKQSSKMHMPGQAPYQLDATFQAGGNAAYTGAGELTETWLSGQSWRWTAKLGGFSIVRIGYSGATVEDKHTPAIPMRVHMLRNAIFWAGDNRTFGMMQLRKAAIVGNGKPATCVLASGMFPTPGTARLWEEEEYCVDNATGLLMVHSFSPGNFTMYTYGASPIHDRYVAEHILISSAGQIVVDARVSMTEPSVNATELQPTPEMLANGLATPTNLPVHFQVNFPDTAAGSTVRPVMVHASVDGNGQVVEEELSAGADPGLVQNALDLVRNFHFPANGAQRQIFVNTRFVPAAR